MRPLKILRDNFENPVFEDPLPLGTEGIQASVRIYLELQEDFQGLLHQTESLFRDERLYAMAELQKRLRSLQNENEG